VTEEEEAAADEDEEEEEEEEEEEDEDDPLKISMLLLQIYSTIYQAKASYISICLLLRDTLAESSLCKNMQF